MSAPDTNTTKEAKRHKPALFGIGGALLVVGALLVAYLVYIAAAGQSPDDAETMIDGRTGAPVATDQ